MKKIKDKESMIKIRMIKQVIFAEKISKFIFYKKIEMIKSMNLSKSCDVILTSAKETDLQDENCFICHKSDYIFRKCSDQIMKVIAVNDDDEEKFN